MPTYSYTAKTLSGKVMRGKANADDESDLMTVLREKQLFLLQAKSVQKQVNNKKLNASELSSFCREIGTMLKAGVPLIRALSIIMNRSNTKKQQQIYNGLYQSLEKGLLLSEAMKEQESVFPELLIYMIQAGESEGKLDQTAMKMAGHYEKEHRLNAKVSGAMTYPVVLLIITIAVVLLIFLVVLPNFFSIFKDMELPFATRIMIAISSGLIHYWYIALAAVFLLLILFGMLIRQNQVQNSIDKLKLRLPYIGKLLKIIYTARFSRTLSSLYQSGIPIVHSLQISKRTIGNRYIEAQFTEATRQVQSGTPLSEALQSIDGFDGKLPSTVLIGEETSRLDTMLSAMADSFEYESEIAVQQLITLLEPLMIVVMACIVGFIMISVLLPILQIYQNVR